MRNWQGSWIWTAEEVPERNAFVRFRRVFDYNGGAAKLHLTADSRYVLWVNGTYLGFGPVRAWPRHWRYDTYDLEPYLRPGRNVIAVLVQHFGESNFQYLAGPAGLLADLELEGATVPTDAAWRVSPDRAFVPVVPRISVQEGFEEQFDARAAEEWATLAYDDTAWAPATVARPTDDGWHQDLQPRGIPFLTHEPVLPQRVVSVETVRSLPHLHTIYVKPYLKPGDLSSNHNMAHAYLGTQVWSPAEVEVQFVSPHKDPGPIRVNGIPAEGGKARLRAGWNNLVTSLRRGYHLPEFTLCVDGPAELRFCATGDQPGPAWAVMGPFALSAEERARVESHTDASLLVAEPLTPAATCARGEQFWESGDVAAAVGEPWFQPVRPEHLPAVDSFAQSYTDRVVEGTARVEGMDGLVSGSEWTTIYPAEGGQDVRLLLDFGREVVALHRFEVVAPAGTVLDFHNFEFIQPDGRYNFAEGMNNSFRYTCREGHQTYQTWGRRGFRYSYLTLRNLTGPVRLGGVAAVFSSYPQNRRGSFACSDAQLDRIWEVGAHTLRCCAEDTYTDCPTYEQTHWVGDARNEALIDWAINGDPRLWYRCLEQTGQSLERSPITESHVPSAWTNILPAWSFLWMRSCREYYLYTGDQERSRGLLGFLARNVDGVRAHLNAQGLFDIRAWNMFDWAPMDTPSRGVVTHQNCMAVHALNDSAELADWLGESALAAEWRALAADLSNAINAHLWNEERAAYTDCLRGSEQSKVYSQQTQTAAVMAGVAQGDRARRCREIIHNPPEGFVRAGSPFFEFFLLEAYQQEGRAQEFVDTIRRDWGFMVDMGATTFWEMWSGRTGRLTRSHCHGWSAAPTFFLSTYVAGIAPGGPGFSPVVVAPHPGDLAWCRATMPTPAGDVTVQWENDPDKPFALRVQAPQGVAMKIALPRAGTATLNGEPVADE